MNGLPSPPPPRRPARGEELHGPTEEDRRAVHAAAARRKAQGPPVPCWAEDEALALAAADRRNAPLPRALAWMAWTYNRSPIRGFLEAMDAPLLLAEGILPPFWRWLAFPALPAERAAAYRVAARGSPRRGSGWLGCLVVLPVWAGFAALCLWLLLLTL